MHAVKLVGAVSIALLAVAAQPSASQQAPKAANRDVLFPASVTFANNIGDAVTSDGAPYANSGGFVVGLHSSTGDLTLQGSDGARWLNLSYLTKVSGSGPTGTSQEFNIYFNVFNILAMARGDHKQTQVTIGTSIVGPNTWFKYNPATFPGTTRVDVDRNADGSWTIAADQSAGTDLASLSQIKGNRTTVYGLYSMPFHATVTCPTCG